MIEVKLIGDVTVYTALSVDEVREYLQAGIKTKSFLGYLDKAGTQEILISVYSILYIAQ